MRSLIVEDNLINQKLLSKLLKALGEVDIAENGRLGAEAFQKAHSQGTPYDLVCLDIMMPEMDGQQTLQEMRKIEDTYGIEGLDRVKVVMTTAVDSRVSIMDAFRSGCEAYLVKPVTKQKLYEQLEKLELIEHAQ